MKIDYTYEFTKISPEHTFVQIKYTSAGRVDLFKNVNNVTDFSEAALIKIAEHQGHLAVVDWKSRDIAKDSVSAPATLQRNITFKDTIYDEMPAYDEETQRIIEVPVEEPENTRITYTVENLTPAEISQKKNEWRMNTKVSMRQARIALFDAGLLPDIDAAIAAAPAGIKEKLLLEWEYATELERNSASVNMIFAQLGKTDDEIDALFKTAMGI